MIDIDLCRKAAAQAQHDGRGDVDTRPSKATANGKPRPDRGEIMDEMPPNSLDPERALLSGALYLGSINSDISIPPHEFYDGRNQAIWDTLVSLNGEGLKIDEAAYLSGLKKHRRWGF